MNGHHKMNNLTETVKTDLLDTLNVEPGKQPRLKLGIFKKEHPPRGFTIKLNPDPEEDAIVTHVTSIEIDDNSYELVLHIANYGIETIRAEVWRM